MNSMNQNVIPLQPTTSATRSAEVTGINETQYQLRLGDQMISALKAFSCLIEPMVSDTVMVSFDENNQAYIIAVLHRNETSTATLSVPANTQIQCEEQLTIQSGKKTAIISEQISEVSDQRVMKTKDAVMDFDKAVVSGQSAHAHVRALHMVGDTITSMARQAIQKFGNYMRKTDQADQVQAAQMTRKTEGLYSMKSGNTIMISQHDTKIDGEHIHMG